MCGITGVIHFAGHKTDEAHAQIKRMTDTLTHRGPDEEGYYVDEFAALGHRRLSIIDRSGGQQPMGALRGTVQVVFNGEIYNFQELRSELEAKGHQFKTRSDTEVILLGYIEWGDRCVEKLHGMFSFVIWDKRNKKLLIARDRVGKKPLYVYHKNQTFAFASELKALLAGGHCPDAIDPEALDCYFSFGYIPAPKTIYRGFRKLPAARYLVVLEGSETEHQYWRLSFAEPVGCSLENAADEFEALLNNAVKCRLLSEVPLGVFLSGGLDSSLVVACMARLLESPVITNSIGFEDRYFNELPTARRVAEHWRTDHHEFMVKPQVAEVLERIAWHFDEPFADSSAVPTWYVCQMAKQSVTVALSGDGGDESFGGYTFRYIPHMIESRLRTALPGGLRRVLFGTLGAIWPGTAWLPKPLRLKTVFENLAVSDVEAFYRDLIWLRSDTRKRLYSADFIESLGGFTPMEVVCPLYTGSDATDALGRCQFTDIQLYMTDNVLVKVDRMSMAHSLEVRSPFLDHRIIEFAARLPASLKTDARRGKLLLRKLASRWLPSEMLKKPKQGFSIPAATWLRNEVRSLAEQHIFDKSTIVSDLFDTRRTRDLWLEHQSGARDHSVFLWGLMMLGLWERCAATVTKITK